MIFQKPVLDHLFEVVEKKHHMSFWQAFCLCVESHEFSGASEYEIYFNFVFSQTDQVKIRVFNWANIESMKLIPKYQKAGFDYVSCHEWMRKK